MSSQGYCSVCPRLHWIGNVWFIMLLTKSYNGHGECFDTSNWFWHIHSLRLHIFDIPILIKNVYSHVAEKCTSSPIVWVWSSLKGNVTMVPLQYYFIVLIFLSASPTYSFASAVLITIPGSITLFFHIPCPSYCLMIKAILGMWSCWMLILLLFS